VGAPSLESCERDLLAQVRRNPGDSGAHEALVRWFRRTGRPIELEPELFQALARRWLAGETSRGLTDLLLADQALETWTAPYDPAPFWVDSGRAELRRGTWVDAETGLPLRLRRGADGAPLALIPAGPEGFFYAAVRPFTFADVLRVGGAVSAGVRSEDLAREDQPAYRVTERAQERLMEWCRGQGPTSREWWVAVLGVDPGKIGAGELPDPESLAGRALATLMQGEGAATTLARTPLGLEEVTLPILAMGHGEIAGGLRYRIRSRERDGRAPGDHRLQLRLRSFHPVEAILRAVHELEDPPRIRIRRGDRLRISLLPARRGLGGWLRDLVAPPPRYPRPRPLPPSPPRYRPENDWTPPEPEPDPEELFPDRSDPEILAATTEAIQAACARSDPDRAPEDLLVDVLPPLVAAHRGLTATAFLPALPDAPVVEENPLVGARHVADHLRLEPAASRATPEDLSAAALALAELRQPLAFEGITEVYLELTERLQEDLPPAHLARLAMLRARQALQRGDLPAARRALAGAPPEAPEERLRWDLAAARAHRDDPARALSLLPRHATGAHRGGELEFLRGSLQLAAGAPEATVAATPALVEGDLARVPTRFGLALPAMDLALLAIARTATGEVPLAWAAAHQARDLAEPWVARRRRSTELNLLKRLDGPPSEDPSILRSQLAALVDILTHPDAICDLPGYLMLEATRRAADLRWAAGLESSSLPMDRRANPQRLQELEDAWWIWVAQVRRHGWSHQPLGEILAAHLPKPEPGLAPRHPEVPVVEDVRLSELLWDINTPWPDEDGW
jgi:hypothetical protein